MINRELKTVVTFHTAADAIATEKACKSNNVAGRIIPVPRELSSGCGLSWASSPELRKVLEELLSRYNIEAEQITDLLI
ncbi:MAG: DUF3343 domain-containing protein [Lachnospiraceae bacterium]|jgi:hypothetical protein|nr:DUF3343 domain-containing protein [Lachnospiraceae bacterium]